MTRYSLSAYNRRIANFEANHTYPAFAHNNVLIQVKYYLVGNKPRYAVSYEILGQHILCGQNLQELVKQAKQNIDRLRGVLS